MGKFNLRYRIRKEAAGWDWAAIGADGSVEASGHAPTKAVAAAWVICHLAKAAPTEFVNPTHSRAA
jgi:hypothetical protein